MKHLVYQITNLLNNKIYIGVHSTDNLDDDYMGSSINLKKDISKFGKNYFKKEVLFIFNNKTDMFLKENELVNKDFCQRNDTYNLRIGGHNFNNQNMFSAKDKSGNVFFIFNDDERYLKGELVHTSKGKEIPSFKNMITVKDKDNNYFKVSKADKRYLSGELTFTSVGMVNVRDKNGNTFRINKDDSRYLSGELVHVNKGKICNKKSKAKQILKISIEGVELEIFNSIKEAKAIIKGDIIACLKNKQKTAGGFIWKYKIENNDL